MNNLKFRAWDNRRKQMNYKVCVGNTDMNDKNYTCSTILIDGEWVHFDDYCDIVVEQYTGLKDRNGKEIYEGDVVNNRELALYSTKGVVRYDTKSGCLVINNVDGRTKRLTVKVIKNNFVEVIGNIHENGDLLK
jgi:uncharacterized phage protein (TIGR01671 family)